MSFVDIIQYREFWDRPHNILFRVEPGLIYMESLFREGVDDFDDSYDVYELPMTVSAEIIAGSWEDLASLALRKLGRVPVHEVVFDQTRRKQIDAGFLDAFAWPKINHG